MLPRLVLLALALLLLAPLASAYHWTRENEDAAYAPGGCWYNSPGCHTAYLCTGRTAPTPSATLPAEFVERATTRAPAYLPWAPRAAWYVADSAPENVEEKMQTYSGPTGYHALILWTVCDDTTWPICERTMVPEHAPADDPVGRYPLAP